MLPSRFALVRVFVALFGAAAFAQDRFVPLNELTLESFEAFAEAPGFWVIGGDIGGALRTESVMEVLPGTGVAASPTLPYEGGNLVTAMDHGDIEVELEFLLSKDGNSGVFFQGRYEVQLWDSWLDDELTFGDLGGIYQRWDEASGGFDGHAPAVNAARAPGLWQTLRVVFRAPRFDETGEKTQNAQFVKVVINGQVVHENVELSGPTRGTLFPAEGDRGPLMLQGGHGPVAYRNIRYKRTEPGVISTGVVNYAWYPGGHREIDDYQADGDPVAAGTSDVFDPHMSGGSGSGTLVASTTFEAPVAGSYGFRTRGDAGRTFLLIDGEVVSNNWSNPVAVLDLAAGSHTLETRYVRIWGASQPDFGVEVEGPEMAPQLLTVPVGNQDAPPAIHLSPETQTLAQRGFVEHAGIMRLGGISVGTPARIHYSYDLTGGAPLKFWRGEFLDMTEMWHHRGEDQVAAPLGDAVELIGVPSVALLPSRETPWPTAAHLALRELGYTRDEAGTPTFSTQLGPMILRDRLEPLPDQSGLQRTLVVSGRSMNHDPWFMLAGGRRIQRDEDGVFVIGDREYYLEWLGVDVMDEDNLNSFEPEIRDSAGRQELLLHVPGAHAAKKTLRYNLIW